jgi:predicted aldo/keto reductase-like oxidoreductase
MHAVPRSGHAQVEAKRPQYTKMIGDVPVVKLGNTDIETTLLGVGTGTHGGNDFLNLGQKEFVDLMHHAFDRGIRYIDTADNYRTHLFVRFAMKGYDRDEFFIQTKTPSRHPEVVKADLNRYRRELKTDYLDSVLMHCMRDGGWPGEMRPVLDVLLEEKEKGRIKSVGVSCHGFDPLLATLDVDELDINLVRINPFQLKMDGPCDQVVPVCEKNAARGLGMIGMKIYGESGLENTEQRYESLKYVMNLGCIDCFTIGFTEKSHIDETIDLVERVRSEA